MKWPLKEGNLLYDVPPFSIFQWKWGVNFSHFPYKGVKEGAKRRGDWWVQQKVKRWKREGGERSGRPAHINAALWASGPVIKFHTIWGSKWHVNYKWPILCFSVTVLNKRGVREIIRLYCAKRGRGGFSREKKNREKRGKRGPWANPGSKLCIWRRVGTAARTMCNQHPHCVCVPGYKIDIMGILSSPLRCSGALEKEEWDKWMHFSSYLFLSPITLQINRHSPLASTMKYSLKGEEKWALFRGASTHTEAAKG